MTAAKIRPHHHCLIKACFRETEKNKKKHEVYKQRVRKGREEKSKGKDKKRTFMKRTGKQEKKRREEWGGEWTEEPPNVFWRADFILAFPHLKDRRRKCC